MMKLILALVSLALVKAASAQCPQPDRQAVTGTVQAMLDAAATDDAAKLEALFAPGFYAFDVGKRYDADSFQDALRKLHQSGTRTAWHVMSPDVHIACNTAWIAYVNKGSFTDSGKDTDRTWLESANLVYVDGSWRVTFLESARASDPALVSGSSVSASTETAEQELMRLEKESYAAVIAKDYQKMRRLLADEWVQQDDSDDKIVRDLMISRLQSGKFVPGSVVFGPMSVDVLGDVATVMGSELERFTFAGKPFALHSNFLDVWAKRNGKWVTIRTQMASRDLGK